MPSSCPVNSCPPRWLELGTWPGCTGGGAGCSGPLTWRCLNSRRFASYASSRRFRAWPAPHSPPIAGCPRATHCGRAWSYTPPWRLCGAGGSKKRPPVTVGCTPPPGCSRAGCTTARDLAAAGERARPACCFSSSMSTPSRLAALPISLPCCRKRSRGQNRAASPAKKPPCAVNSRRARAVSLAASRAVLPPPVRGAPPRSPFR